LSIGRGSVEYGGVKVVVYVKPGCHLCEPFLQTIEKVRPDFGFELEEVDISGDPELLDKYGHEIPVALIDGKKAFKYRLTEPELRKKLARAQGGAGRRAGAEAQAIDSLESLEPAPFIPPRPIAVLLVALALVAFGYFVALGLRDAGHGRGRLAGQLLRADLRDQMPIRFELEDLNGKKVSLDDYRDKVVFLNFWATWCPPCVEEWPSMVRLHERMKRDPRFVMLAVSADEGWDPVRKFLAGRPPPQYPVLLDASGKIAHQYGTTMFPETYIVVRGNVVGFIEGPRDWDKWFADEYLKALLEDRA
jgi:thiol-disulfide isomerase/thioredoxin